MTSRRRQTNQIVQSYGPMQYGSGPAAPLDSISREENGTANGLRTIASNIKALRETFSSIEPAIGLRLSSLLARLGRPCRESGAIKRPKILPGPHLDSSENQPESYLLAHGSLSHREDCYLAVHIFTNLVEVLQAG